MKAFLDYAERAALALLFAAAALANVASSNPLNLLLMVGHIFSVGFVVFRRRGFDLSRSPIDWFIAIVGTVLSLMLRPSDTVIGPPAIGAALLWAGAAIAVAAKFSLNTRFGVVPANRGVQTRWAYRIVRHPMYLGYMVAEAGYLLQNWSWANLLLLTAVWPLQIYRLFREERWLAADPAYVSYMGQTRRRLIPGVF